MNKWVLILFVSMNWIARIGGPNHDPDEERVALFGEMRQEFLTLEACNRVLDPVNILMNNNGGHLDINGFARCEPINGG